MSEVQERVVGNGEQDYWQGQFAGGRISRREFCGRLAALGLVGTTAAGLIHSADEARAETPTRGGRLRLGWYTSSAADTLDPRRLTTSTDYMRAFSVGSSLTRYAPDLSPQPDLAESWEANADATEWRFRITKDVVFSNGQTLTPRDVVYSLNLHRGAESESVISAWFQPVTDIAVDDQDVVVTLESPNGDFPMYLGDPHTVIVPDGFEDFGAFVGTGPFVLDRFQPGVSMLATRNPNYHFDGRPYVDEVQSFGIPDTQTRVNALIAGDCDYIPRVDPKLIPLVRGAPGVAMANAKGSRHVTMPMMADRTPMSNPDLRLAIKLLADRKGMLDDVLQGYGSLGNDTPLGPSDRYYCWDLPQREIDVDRARFLLERADFAGGTLTLHTSEAAGGAIAPAVAAHLADSAAQAGLTIDVSVDPTDGYWSDVWMQKPFHMSNWMPRPTADLRFTLTHFSDARWNESRFSNPLIDQLIIKARGLVDGPERRAVYCELQRLIRDDGATLVPLFTDWLDARSERVQGWTGHPVGEGDGFRIHETAWLS